VRYDEVQIVGGRAGCHISESSHRLGRSLPVGPPRLRDDLQPRFAG